MPVSGTDRRPSQHGRGLAVGPVAGFYELVQWTVTATGVTSSTAGLSAFAVGDWRLEAIGWYCRAFTGSANFNVGIATSHNATVNTTTLIRTASTGGTTVVDLTADGTNGVLTRAAGPTGKRIAQLGDTASTLLFPFTDPAAFLRFIVSPGSATVTDLHVWVAFFRGAHVNASRDND